MTFYFIFYIKIFLKFRLSNFFIIPYFFGSCGALRDLVPFVQIKKREKHPWRSDFFESQVPYKGAS